jgi:hypothetical protein
LTLLTFILGVCVLYLLITLCLTPIHATQLSGAEKRGATI